MTFCRAFEASDVLFPLSSERCFSACFAIMMLYFVSVISVIALYEALAVASMSYFAAIGFASVVSLRIPLGSKSGIWIASPPKWHFRCVHSLFSRLSNRVTAGQHADC